MGFKNGDEFHDGIDTYSHRIEVKHLRMFFRVDFIQTFLEHLGFLQIWFFSCVLAPGKENVCVRGVLPAWI